MDNLPSGEKRGDLGSPRSTAHGDARIGTVAKLAWRSPLLELIQLIWLTIVVLSLGVFVATIPTRFDQLLELAIKNSAALAQFGLTPDFVGWYVVALDTLTLLGFALVGIVIFARKSSERLALYASLALITTGVAIVRPADSLAAIDPILRVPMLLTLALGTGTIVIFLYIFPDGHFAPGWTRWVALASALYAFGMILVPAIVISPMPWPPPPLSALTQLAVAGGAAVQIYRYLGVSNPTQQQQTKWVVFGLGLAAIGLIGFLLVVPVLVPSVLQPGSARVWYILVGLLLFDLSLLSFPMALGFSILRYRLWEIDLLINRTLVYVPLTAILAGVFAAAITLSQKFFVTVTGQQSDAAIVVTTLLVVAVFTPIKDRLQALVDKRFKEAPDPSIKLKAFQDQVKTRVSSVRAVQIIRRLLEEAVTAFGATCGRAYLEERGSSQLVHSVGEWRSEAGLSVSIQSATKTIGTIALGVRKSGEEYTPKDRESLQLTCQIVARAIEEDRDPALSEVERQAQS